MDLDGTESDYESGESDKELQVAFSQGLIEPGLHIQKAVKEKKPCIYDQEGLKESLLSFTKDLPWTERLDLAVNPVAPPKPMRDQLGENPDDLEGDAVHDDFKREMKFYRQAQAAVLEALPRLNSVGIATKRPTDYMAEMAKPDHHMKKVREKLMSKQHAIERSEKAKKLRELRKYGKKVQQNVLLKRQKEKKEMIDAVKKYRKGQSDKLDFLNDDDPKQRKKPVQQKSKQQFQPGKKRALKNKKFGFGGQKKRSKLNTAESARDNSDFNPRVNSKMPFKQKGKPARGNKNKRLGKSKRQKQKSKQK